MPSSDVPSTCWIHPALETRRSPIDGRGLFTKRPLQPGVIVVMLGGRLVTTEELLDLISAATEYVDSVSVDPEVHLVLPPGTAAHFANHSCEPNLVVQDALSFATAGPIRAGEELTLDYATISGAPGVPMQCHCGAASCRGILEA